MTSWRKTRSLQRLLPSPLSMSGLSPTLPRQDACRTNESTKNRQGHYPTLLTQPSNLNLTLTLTLNLV